MKIKRQDKLGFKAFLCFLIDTTVNHPRDTVENLGYLGSAVHSRNVTWARSPPSVSVSADNYSTFVAEKGYMLGLSRDKRYKKMWIWKNLNSPQPSQACPPASNRTSPQALLLRLLRPSRAGGPHWRVGEAPPRLPRFSGSLVGGILSEQTESPAVQNSSGTQEGGGGLLRLTPLRYRPESMRLGTLPAPVCLLNHHHLFLGRTRRMIALRLSWEGGLLTS